MKVQKGEVISNSQAIYIAKQSGTVWQFIDTKGMIQYTIVGDEYV